MRRAGRAGGSGVGPDVVQDQPGDQVRVRPGDPVPGVRRDTVTSVSCRRPAPGPPRGTRAARQRCATPARAAPGARRRRRTRSGRAGVADGAGGRRDDARGGPCGRGGRVPRPAPSPRPPRRGPRPAARSGSPRRRPVRRRHRPPHVVRHDPQLRVLPQRHPGRGDAQGLEEEEGRGRIIGARIGHDRRCGAGFWIGQAPRGPAVHVTHPTWW